MLLRTGVVVGSALPVMSLETVPLSVAAFSDAASRPWLVSDVSIVPRLAMLPSECCLYGTGGKSSRGKVEPWEGAEERIPGRRLMFYFSPSSIAWPADLGHFATSIVELGGES